MRAEIVGRKPGRCDDARPAGKLCAIFEQSMSFRGASKAQHASDDVIAGARRLVRRCASDLRAHRKSHKFLQARSGRAA